ncbi:sugar fermentation stimulation protein [Oribacterium sp. C9]|uniref:putative glycoside hydrolase n=1 Tax=Oribacterium sp. C9 TaxID=1943579 RepID=UPI00098ED2A8|nr:putative glycoside hydrolase [Oribacterium sp. C9]OON86052.1 sugar fermentation stimulation protein [Oribacterium sp. C9]
MKKVLAMILLLSLVLLGCQSQTPLVYNVNKSDELREYEAESIRESEFEESLEQQRILAESESQALAQAEVWTKKKPEKEAVKVKGIYISSKMAGSATMQKIIDRIDATELNAVVIDILDDQGHIEYDMHGDLIEEIGSVEHAIPDIQSLMKTLKEHNIYSIARIVTFRDPYLENVKPEWLNHNADGTVFHDNSGMAWINPYNRDAWEYKVQVAEQCADVGFDEIQFDYVRFCTEKGMNSVVYSESDTNGMGKTDIITEFVRFASDRLAAKGVFMSADVFGTIIGSYVDTVSVGQDYPVMAGAVDYMCPMIYPSHYGNGNFGLDVPDTHHYEAILGACNASKKDLSLEYQEGIHQAKVRPWLQGFTASYLPSYIHYGAEEVRQEIQAVYDAGYDEWLIWNAANDYPWDAFLPAA